MGRGVNGGHPVLDVFIKQWPSLIFLPAILGLIVVLVAVTRWWDQRHKARPAGVTALPIPRQRQRRSSSILVRPAWAVRGPTYVVRAEAVEGAADATGPRLKLRDGVLPCATVPVGAGGDRSDQPGWARL